MSEQATIKKERQVNLNTILMFIALGAMAWVGNETVANGKHLAAIDSIQGLRSESTTRLEKKVDELTSELTKQRDIVFDIRLQLASIPGVKMVRTPKDP